MNKVIIGKITTEFGLIPIKIRAKMNIIATFGKETFLSADSDMNKIEKIKENNISAEINKV